MSQPHVAKAFPSEKALNRYLEQHPKADKSKHHVESITDGQDRAKKERDKAKVKRDEGKLKDDLKKHKEDHPEGSVNWNYDPKNRTKEQEEKADKATEKEARMALAERFKAARRTQNLVLRFKEAQAGLEAKTAGPMVIGPRGLEKPGGTNLTLQEGAAYWIGASSSPQMVVVTDVNDKQVKYKRYPFTGGTQAMERWIFADLAAKGSAQYLRTYGAHMDPGLKHSLESLLKGGKGRKENMDDYRPVTMTLAPADSQAGQDLWYAAEEYGGVGGEHQDDGSMLYVVDTQQKSVEKAKNDPRFKVLKVVNRTPSE